MIKLLLIVIVVALAVYGGVQMYENPEEIPMTFSKMMSLANLDDINQQCLNKDLEGGRSVETCFENSNG